MLFPTHVIAGSLLGYGLRLPALPAAAGAALPDLVDKPLAMVGVVEIYHSVGHSSLVLLACLPIVRLGRAGLAFWAGWASHLLLDVVHMVVNGRPGDAVFLLWPAVVRESSLGLGPIAFSVHYVGTPSFFLEIPVWVAFAYVAWREVRPTAAGSGPGANGR